MKYFWRAAGSCLANRLDAIWNDGRPIFPDFSGTRLYEILVVSIAMNSVQKC